MAAGRACGLHEKSLATQSMEHKPSRLTDLQRQLRRNDAIGATTDAVRPEIFTCHHHPDAAEIREAGPAPRRPGAVW